MSVQLTEKRVQQVLLVEDNRIHREVATAVLERHGFTVVHAGDGQEALEQLVRDRFSLVLMDIDMPWMDGATSAEFIRTMKYRGEIGDIPVIAVTAETSEGNYQRCMAAGIIDVIPKHIWKPKWEELIVERLEKIMERVEACWLPLEEENPDLVLEKRL